ncbi:MAG: VOC family protein [Treponema sp.]|jgi:lactoylglutathione lyase|nr:VOC family protein [Treponema sp.]
MTVGLGHVAIRARDIEKTVAFYRDVLGFPEAFRMYDLPGGALGSVHIYIAPNQFIEIFPGERNAQSESESKAEAIVRPIGLVHICLTCGDIEEAFQEARARGAPIDTEIKTGVSKCLQFWTHDPDGNAIEFMQLAPDCLRTQAMERLKEKTAP